MATKTIEGELLDLEKRYWHALKDQDVGMATVYLARDLKHDRPVALKVLHPAPRSSSG